GWQARVLPRRTRRAGPPGCTGHAPAGPPGRAWQCRRRPRRSRRRRFRCRGLSQGAGAVVAPIWRHPVSYAARPAARAPVPLQRIRMPSVKVRENEPFEFALRRFKRTCEKAGVLAETRKREFYEKPTQERKRKAAAAVKRQLRRSSRDVTKRQRLY